jgi:hypothetical protein
MKKDDLKLIEKKIIELLDNHTSNESVGKSGKYKEYQLIIKDFNTEQLKSVISGCALFRLENSNSRIFSKKEEHKETAKYKVDISNIYLEYAKELLYISY